MALSSTVFAQEHGGGGEGGEKSADPNKEVFVEIRPAFITNLASDYPRYLKTDISIRVKGSKTAEAIGRHEPLIKNAILMLLAQQDGNVIATVKGKEDLRIKAKEEVAAALESEHEAHDIIEILFVSFMME
ncbi:MAG TPA: flagellar basal body-associated FliL family protein [Pseudomonadales bacterium]|nr:flagellar basal body-associated FliL family protein [Pseudomonadales bacterium]